MTYDRQDRSAQGAGEKQEPKTVRGGRVVPFVRPPKPRPTESDPDGPEPPSAA